MSRSALVVEDEPAVRQSILRQLAAAGFETDAADIVAEARAKLSRSRFDLVVCDLALPDGSGLELIETISKENPETATVIASGRGSTDTASDALAHGVDQYLFKPFSGEQLHAAVTAALRRRREHTSNEERIADTKRIVSEGLRASALPVADAVLSRLGKAGRFRDEETAEHVERMSRTCGLIARQLGWETERCVDLRAASALHDVGKIGIPDAILQKPGRLTAEERSVIERHPVIGHEILAGTGNPVIELAADIALTHHERVDGKGYPRGLAGEEIPLAGRIAAVADVFDAMTHDRVYRAAFSPEKALAMMREGRGSQFDHQVLAAFEAVVPSIAELERQYPDPAATERPDDVGRHVRVLIVEDHEALARGLDLLLRREGFEIAGRASSLSEARGLLDRRAVDVVILDLQLGADEGIDLVPVARAAGAAVLIYTGRDDPTALAAAKQAGAQGMAAKAGSPSELVRAIESVAGDDTYTDPRFNEGTSVTPSNPALTPREREVVQLLAQGLNGEEIAARLFLSSETVRTHVRNAMDGLQARTRAHLIAIAVANNEIAPGPARPS